MIEMYLEMSDAFWYAWLSHGLKYAQAWNSLLGNVEDFHGMYMGGGEL